MGISIRRYEPGDLAAIQAITAEAFEGVSAIHQYIERRFGPINGTDWRSRKARDIDADVAREPEGIFVAESRDEVVGYITTWTDKEAMIGHIPNVAVILDRQGQGIGRRLIEYVMDRFRNIGMTHAKIETLEPNERGYHLYTSLGFEEMVRQVHLFRKL